MRPAFPTSDYYGPSAPPRRHQPTASLATPAAHQERRDGDTGTVPTFTTLRSTGSAPSSSPAASPRVRRRLPRGLTTDRITSASESPPAAIAGGVRCAPARIHQVRAGVTLEGVQPLVHSRCTFRLAERALDRLAVPVRLAFIGAAPTLTRAPGIGLPPASARLLRQPDVGALSSPLDWVAPRGAQCGADAHVALLREPLTIRQPAACAESGGASLVFCATSAKFPKRRSRLKRAPNAAFQAATSPPRREETHNLSLSLPLRSLL
jgi:hypothetical protein